MTSHRTDPDLLTRASRGDIDAVRGLVAKVTRTVHNVLYRSTSSRDLARDLLPHALRRVVVALPERPWGDAPLSNWLLDVARDTCYEQLPSSTYQLCVFAQARDALSEPVTVPPLSLDFLDADEAPLLGLDTGFKETLGPGQLLVLELLFIERVPIEALAEFLGVSLEVVSSFVYTVFDVLGDTSNLTHDAACAHDLKLALQVIQCATRPAKVRELEEKHGRCRSCILVVRRCLRIVRLFEIDSRLPARLDPKLLDAVLAPLPPPQKPADGGSGRLLTAPAGAGGDRVAAGLGGAGGTAGIPGLTGASFDAQRADRRLRRPAPPEAPSSWPFIILVAGLVGLMVGVVPRYLRPAPDIALTPPPTAPSTPVIGTFDNPYLQGQPIHVGQVIASAKNHRTSVSLESGLQLELEPCAVVKVLAREVVVVSGKVGVAVAHGITGALRIGERGVTFASGEGVVDVGGGQASVSVLRGESTVTGTDGTVRIDGGRKAMLAVDHVMVGDMTDREVAAAEAGSGTSRASGDTPASGSSDGTPTQIPSTPFARTQAPSLPPLPAAAGSSGGTRGGTQGSSRAPSYRDFY